ncbi:MAG: SDR family NAD(P)-dependent oxidoreductase [Gemmatimonadota bacterium]
MNPADLTGRRVLLTGATGFLGSHIAEGLCASGATVRCTVRKTSNLRWLEALSAETVELDLARADLAETELNSVLAGVAVVVHSAGLTRAPNEETFQRVNAKATDELARAAVRNGVGRFVLISSLAARGPDAATVTSAAAPAALDSPVSPYGRSKLEGERRLRAAADTSEMAFVILRPGGIYGPRDEDLLPMYQMARLGFLSVPMGRGRLQPVFVKDVARAALAAAEGHGTGGTFPIAEPFIYTWDEVAAALSEAVGRKVRPVPVPPALIEAAGTAADIGARLFGQQPRFDRRRARDIARLQWTCDTTAAEEGLRWVARVPLAEGMAETAEWYREIGWLRR